MATIKAVLESLDNVQAELHDFYTEAEDGKFYLNLTDDVRGHPKTQPLQNAHNRSKEALTAAKAELAELQERLAGLPDDFDADALAELQAKADAGGGKDVDAQLAAMRTSLEDRHRKQLAAEIDKREKTIEELRSGMNKSKIDAELSAAMDAAKIDPKHRKAVKALLKSESAIEVTDEGTVVVQSSQGFPVALTEYVLEQIESDLKPYISLPSGDGERGNKNPGTAGNNPFLAAQWNKTKQAQLPADKREGLAKAAGFAHFEAAMSASKAIK